MTPDPNFDPLHQLPTDHDGNGLQRLHKAIIQASRLRRKAMMVVSQQDEYIRYLETLFADMERNGYRDVPLYTSTDVGSV
jgi:hypothetical protein